MKSLSFDGIARLYDETRVADNTCFNSVLDYIASRFPPGDYPHVFEPGIGTGRIAIPLAQRGYKVTGVDIAPHMLGALSRRLEELHQPLDIFFEEADTTALSYRDGVFDAAIIVHLFYFIPDWKRAVDEISRVVKPDGPLLLMNTGLGTEVPLLTKRYKELCSEKGFETHYIGATSTKYVVDHLAGAGFETETISGPWQWTVRQSLDQAMYYFRYRAYSYTTFAPDSVHLSVIERMEADLREEFGGLQAEVETPAEISLTVARRHSCAAPAQRGRKHERDLG